ncbi:BgtE-5913 [Blumeria graminis f. sp. tritici]|uniref:BgtE-5913 n=2 Tax=Blumeria graminis f. sp. tritici TaxID=62690 RepID=A0A9X9MJY1_BLUGR|nr:BgtE-5913 [Blumeria graminis f. sp. tritici]
MKLIHIISSVAIFALPALADNDWNCGTNTIYANTINRAMHDVYYAYRNQRSLAHSDISESIIFVAKFKVPELKPQGTEFKLEFNKEFKISSFKYIHNGNPQPCREL